MLGRKSVFTSFVLGLFLASFVVGQEKPNPLTLEKIEESLKEGVLPSARLAALIRDIGVSFEVTPEIRERLRKVGADVVVMQEVERAAVEYAKRKLEEERRKVEEEKRRAEQERRRVEEERQRTEEAKRRETQRPIQGGVLVSGDLGLLDLEKRYMILVTKEGKLVTIDFNNDTQVTRLTTGGSQNVTIRDLVLGSSTRVTYSTRGNNRVAHTIEFRPPQ